MAQSVYDVIVCGGGTAGCIVAARLAENPEIKVLLLEAGGDDRRPEITDSRIWMSNIGSDRDWQFRAEPSASVNGRTPPLPMGRVLGGGSSVNGLVWARGHKSDFDLWAAETGDPGWGFEAALEIYKRIERWDGPVNPKYRGTDGPVYLTLPKEPIPVASALCEAAPSVAGVPFVEDLNAEAMEGPGACGIVNVTVEGGSTRVSMANSYLRPMMDRANLTVLLGATVRRLILIGRRVTGVEFEVDGKISTAQATSEVVLSLGAINTPKVLMLSGIGDRAALSRLNIEEVQHLPGVGQNFQDHILVAGCVWEYISPEAPRNNSAEFTIFCKSDPSLPAPDLQPILEETGFGSEVTRPQYDVPSDPTRCWTMAPGLIRPHSRGHLHLTGNRPDDPVKIHANFLSDPRDVTALLRCIEICREIGNSPTLRPFVKREIMPGLLGRPAMEEFLRNAAGTYFHQTCTAKMGRDAMSVVDGSLRVYGIDGLRIADGSVMPAIAGGNTMAPCALIGERAADLIRSALGIAA